MQVVRALATTVEGQSQVTCGGVAAGSDSRTSFGDLLSMFALAPSTAEAASDLTGKMAAASKGRLAKDLVKSPAGAKPPNRENRDTISSLLTAPAGARPPSPPTPVRNVLTGIAAGTESSFATRVMDRPPDPSETGHFHPAAASSSADAADCLPAPGPDSITANRQSASNVAGVLSRCGADDVAGPIQLVVASPAPPIAPAIGTKAAPADSEQLRFSSDGPLQPAPVLNGESSIAPPNGPRTAGRSTAAPTRSATSAPPENGTGVSARAGDAPDSLRNAVFLPDAQSAVTPANPQDDGSVAAPPIDKLKNSQSKPEDGGLAEAGLPPTSAAASGGAPPAEVAAAGASQASATGLSDTAVAAVTEAGPPLTAATEVAAPGQESASNAPASQRGRTAAPSQVPGPPTPGKKAATQNSAAAEASLADRATPSLPGKTSDRESAQGLGQMLATAPAGAGQQDGASDGSGVVAQALTSPLRTQGDASGSASELPANAQALPQPSSFAEAPISPALQSARVLERMGQAELRVGVNTAGFGNVEIRALVADSHVAASIATGHSELRAAMMAEMPSLQQAMEQRHLRLERFDLNPQTGGQKQGSGSAEQQPRSNGGAGFDLHASGVSVPVSREETSSPAAPGASWGINVHA